MPSFKAVAGDSDPDTHRVRAHLLDKYPGPRSDPELLARGYYCCPSCTVQYQLALHVADPDLHRSQEAAFLDALRGSRANRRRRHRYPFYYTVLVLDEIATPGAKEELHEVARLATRLPAAEVADTSADRKARFRARAAQILRSAA